MIAEGSRGNKRSVSAKLSLGLILLGGCGGSGAYEMPPLAPANETTIGAGDIFEVRVYGEEELSSTYRVAEDGSIDFPLVGRVEVGGLEPTQVADLLTEQLRTGEYLREPQVSVLVTEYNSKRISVMGAVARPGTFPLTAGLTVVQAVSLAGGFTTLASKDDAVLTRRLEEGAERFRVPIGRISEGRAEDLLVQAGDIIFVPERVF